MLFHFNREKTVFCLGNFKAEIESLPNKEQYSVLINTMERSLFPVTSPVFFSPVLAPSKNHNGAKLNASTYPGRSNRALSPRPLVTLSDESPFLEEQIYSCYQRLAPLIPTAKKLDNNQRRFINSLYKEMYGDYGYFLFVKDYFDKTRSPNCGHFMEQYKVAKEMQEKFLEVMDDWKANHKDYLSLVNQSQFKKTGLGVTCSTLKIQYLNVLDPRQFESYSAWSNSCQRFVELMKNLKEIVGLDMPNNAANDRDARIFSAQQ